MKMTETTGKYPKYWQERNQQKQNKFWKLTQNGPITARQNLILEPKENYIQMTSNLVYFVIRIQVNKIKILSWFRACAKMVNNKSYDMIQVKSDSDFGEKFSIVQFYAIEHNSKFNCWIKLKFDMKILEVMVYVKEKFQMNRSLERTCDIGQNRKSLPKRKFRFKFFDF
jgi:hypothetical protein